jgi:pantetheine-phosphate adenylyltransferase
VTVALYPGSFDPIHLGHLAIIEYAARNFDEVIVAVLANPNKDSGMFNPEERVRLVTEAAAHLPAVRCIQFYGLTVGLAQRQRADVLIRAGHKEHDIERPMAAMNQTMTGIPTAFAPVDWNTRAISASLVRQLVQSGQLAAAVAMVPPSVRPALVEKATQARLPVT